MDFASITGQSRARARTRVAGDRTDAEIDHPGRRGALEEHHPAEVPVLREENTIRSLRQYSAVGRALGEIDHPDHVVPALAQPADDGAVQVLVREDSHEPVWSRKTVSSDDRAEAA